MFRFVYLEETDLCEMKEEGIMHLSDSVVLEMCGGGVVRHAVGLDILGCPGRFVLEIKCLLPQAVKQQILEFLISALSYKSST